MASKSHLSDLGFQLLTPQPALRTFIRSFWYFRRDTPLHASVEELIHPRGGFGVMFNFGDRLRLDGQPISEPVCLDATNTISRTVGFSGRVELLGIRFHEGGAYPFLGVPLNELRNASALLDLGQRPAFLALHNRLCEVTLPTRIIILEAWLLERLSHGKQRDPLIPASLSLLRHRFETLSIPQLAKECAISQRQLERLYQDQVGMSPKQYMQLLRIDAARQAIKIHPPTAELAVNLGFYDQSHFIREFRAVVGMTPTAYKGRTRNR